MSATVAAIGLLLLLEINSSSSNPVAATVAVTAEYIRKI